MFVSFMPITKGRLAFDDDLYLTVLKLDGIQQKPFED
jgi:hypothetical protein